jgi:hypothetical protein
MSASSPLIRLWFLQTAGLNAADQVRVVAAHLARTA